jgi:hypothetical protein
MASVFERNPQWRAESLAYIVEKLLIFGSVTIEIPYFDWGSYKLAEKDYREKLNAMRGRIYQAAKIIGRKVTTEEVDGCIVARLK